MYVKQKKTGQMGYLPDAEFNPDEYEEIKDPSIVSQLDGAYKQTQAQNIVQPQATNQSSQPNTITGHTPQEHMKALQSARAAGDKTAEADILANYNAEYQYQKDTGSIGGESDKEKKESEAKTKTKALTLVDELLKRDTGAVTGARNPFKYATGEAQYTKALLDQIKALLSIEGRSALKGSGQISDFEVKMLEDSMSALATNKNGNYILKNEDLKKELLKIQEALGGEANSQTAPTSQGGFGENAKDIMNSILGIPSQVMNAPQNAMALQDQYGSMGQSILSGEGPGRDLLMGSSTGMLPEYNQALGEPLKGGDVISRIADRAKEKPITTAMDVASLLPFLRIGKGTKTGQVAETAGKVGKAKTSLADIPNLSKSEMSALQTAEKIAEGSKKLGKVLPRTWLNKAKQNAFDLYEGVKVDTKVIEQSGKDFVKRYPSAQNTYNKYTRAIKSIDSVKKLDDVLKEWGDVFKKNKDIKPGINNDLIANLWKSGRQELATKAPKVDKVKMIMGETMDMSAAAGKALWKSVLAKMLFIK